MSRVRYGEYQPKDEQRLEEERDQAGDHEPEVPRFAARIDRADGSFAAIVLVWPWLLSWRHLLAD